MTTADPTIAADLERYYAEFPDPEPDDLYDARREMEWTREQKGLPRMASIKNKMARSHARKLRVKVGHAARRGDWKRQMNGRPKPLAEDAALVALVAGS